MIRIEFTGAYTHSLRKLVDEYTLVRKNVDIAVNQFRKNPKDTRLYTHALKKRMKGKYAFSVSDDIRIIFVWLGKSTARFLAIGKHKEVYGH